MIKTSILIISCVLFSFNCFAQKEKREKKKKAKELPENIETFPKSFLIRPRFVYPQVWVDVSSRLYGKGNRFTYKPSIAGVVGLSLKIKKVYISAAIQLPANTNFTKKYGATKFRNININIQGRIVSWGLFYRDYKGFYLDNYKPYYANWNKDSLGFPKSQGTRITETGINLGFNFNKNFSTIAAFAQGERQKKTAGSFLMGFSERYQRIETDTNFVPPTQEVYYPNLDKITIGNFISTIISIGYGRQFVLRKFHFTPLVMVGSGIQFQKYILSNTTKNRVNIPTYLNTKAQLGYNGNHFFANIIYSTEYNTVPIKESKIRLYSNWLEFGMGLRF